MYVCLYRKTVCKEYRTEGGYCRYLPYIRISIFVHVKESTSQETFLPTLCADGEVGG